MNDDLPRKLEECSFTLAVPYNHDPDYVEKVFRPFASHITEVYLPVHWSACDTGRPWTGPQGRRAYYDTVAALYADIGQAGTRLCFLANDLDDEADWPRVVDEVGYLAQRFPGSSFILSSLFVAQEIHRIEPEIQLSPSTLTNIDSPTAARYWMEEAGSTTVTISRTINRRPDKVRLIRKLGLRIRMVLNDDCLPHCPFEKYHLASMRAAERARRFSGSIDIEPLWRCRPDALKMKRERVWMLAQANVLPGHLPHLHGLVDIAKLAGRDKVTPLLVDHIQAYVEMRSLTHADWYQEPEEGWDRVASCDRVCEECGWCEDNILPLDGLARI